MPKVVLQLCSAAFFLAMLLTAHATDPQFPRPDSNLHGGFPFLFEEVDVDCAGEPGVRRTLTVSLPEGSTIIQVYTEMANYPWVGGGERCRSDIQPPAIWKDCPPDGECEIGWSKVRNVDFQVVDGRQVVSADFYNWKHDNIRRARLLVFYRR